MSVRNRIATGNALLNRSRAVLAAVENGRRAGMALAGAAGILPVKLASALDGAAQATLVQRHGGH